MAKVMKLLDPSTGLMECKVCGARHHANIRPDSGGKYYRKNWKCSHGCKLTGGLPERIMFRATSELLKAVEDQAEKERRGRGGMLRVLVEDGLAARRKKGG